MATNRSSAAAQHATPAPPNPGLPSNDFSQSGTLPRVELIDEPPAEEPAAIPPPPPAQSQSDAPQIEVHMTLDPSQRPIPLGGGGHRRRIGWLARRFSLDIYGSTALEESAIPGMNRIARVLFLVFVVDLAAWTLLFNSLLHGGQFEFDLLTIVALTFGALFATGIIDLDAEFITEVPGKKLAFFMARIAVIVGATAMQAQPLKVAIFYAPIRERIHEESVWKEASRRASQFKEFSQEKQDEKIASAKKHGTHNVGSEMDGQVKLAESKVKDARDALQKTLEAFSLAKGNLDRQVLVVAGTQNQLTSAQGRYSSDPDTQASYQRAVAALQTQLQKDKDRQAVLQTSFDQASFLKNEAEQKVASAENTQKDVEREKTDKIKGINSSAHAAAANMEDVSRWLAEYLRRIHSAAPGTEVSPCPKNLPLPRGWDCTPYKDEDYHFFARLRVLDDLREGKAPQFSPEARDELAKQGVTFLPTVASASNVSTSYYVAYGLAMFLPLLGLLAKFRMKGPLKSYYDPVFQANNGNRRMGRYLEARARTNDAKRRYPQLTDQD